MTHDRLFAMIRRAPLAASFALHLLFLAAPALAAGDVADRSSLQLDASIFLEQPAAEPELAPIESVRPFGAKGSWWWSVGGGVGLGADDADGDYTAHFGLHTFLVDDFELAMEFGPWYFDQDVDDAIAGAFNLMFRWHFINRDRYSVFAEAGAGLMVASDEVPDGGSEFNFMPRVGAGMTWRFSDGPARLILGARWQHISNGRVYGDDRNPGRDTAMIFTGVVIPF